MGPGTSQIMKIAAFLLMLSTVGLSCWVWFLKSSIAPQPVVANTAPQPVAPPVDHFSELAQMIRRAHSEPGLAGSAVGFVLLGPDGTVLVSENGETAQIPASTLKTLTSSTALQLLGPDHTIRTRLECDSPPVAGVLTGDLTIRGGGDPMLSNVEVLAWAAMLKKQGIEKVAGNIVGDGSLFTGSLYADFWNWGDIGNGYGSAVCGLNLDHNRYDVTFVPGAEVGTAADVWKISPQLPWLTYENQVTTGPAQSGDAVVIYGGERTNRVAFRGTVPVDSPQTSVTGAIPDPERYAAHALLTALQKAGIAVTGTALAQPSSKKSPHLLLETHSPTLLEIITSLHASSDNQETECLYRLIGVHSGKPPEKAIQEHWKAQGLGFIGLRLADGCGLARANHIRPLDLAKLQHFAARGPHGAAYVQSLLSREGGKLRWKGGAMSSIRSTTGYVMDQAGTTYSFALMFNHYADSASTAKLREALLNAILAWQ
jgi:serine-type D-Ala-D-Ala carboxypeptidase/endopeptidase (penicillin-binding protein 4)